AYAKTGNAWCPNIPGWDNYPLLQELQQAINKKIKIDSDRACYILGETWKGSAKDCNDAIFLSVGTGIGAGILVNGKVLRGTHDIAGAIGWLGLSRPFDKKYIPCGDFEYHASGEGLVKVAREIMLAENLSTGSLAKMNTDELSAKDIFEAFDKND